MLNCAFFRLSANSLQASFFQRKEVKQVMEVYDPQNEAVTERKIGLERGATLLL